MVKKNLGFVWECECGNIEYGEYPPMSCSKCDGIEAFTKVPEEMVEEKELEAALSVSQEDEDD